MGETVAGRASAFTRQADATCLQILGVRVKSGSASADAHLFLPMHRMQGSPKWRF
jgi:hypothetical protein